MTTIRLWDLPIRLFHWLLVLAAVGAVISIKSGAINWHERFGLAVVGLLSFRIIWGFIGSTYARFASFVRGPGAIIDYLRGRWQGVGHNPLGALSVLALIGLFGFQAASGLFANDEIAFNGPLTPLVSSAWSDTLSSWHHLTEWFLYGLVILHVAAVVLYSKVKKDNLLKPLGVATGDIKSFLKSGQDLRATFSVKLFDPSFCELEVLRGYLLVLSQGFPTG